MAQIRSVEGQVELKCHADKFFDVWASNAHLISKISPNKVAKVELVDGEWNKVGAVINWTYLINENGETSLISAKTRVEELNFNNMSLRYNLLDGYVVQNYYKTFKPKMEVTPNGEEGCIMKWSIEYEKMNECAPEPKMHVDLSLELAKEIAAHLCSA